MNVNEVIEKLKELQNKGYGEYILENCEGYSNTPYILKIDDNKKIIEYQ